MPAPRNPFPGMNPYLQADWDDVHLRLLALISEALSSELPPDLLVRAEARVTVAGTEQKYRPDVAVVEPWLQGRSAHWTPEHAGSSASTVAEPIVIYVEPERERWLEIRDARGRVITVVEILSPSNKSESGWRKYQRKQSDYLTADINLVEIDLIRGGRHVLAVPPERFSTPPGAGHLICVARQPLEAGRREIYPCALRVPLPTIRIPLRDTDADVPLALQPLIDECYRIGRYWLADYGQPLDPPMAEDDAAWVGECLHAAGLA